jgi:hypothetical protein
MPISQTESGLTTSQYNAVMAATEDPVWQVIAHKFNLDFKDYDNSQSRQNDTDFDVVVLPNFSAIATNQGGTIYFYHDDLVSAVPPTTVVSGYSNSVYAASLIYDDANSKLYIFFSDGSTITRKEYAVASGGLTDNGNTAMSVSLGANESIVHISAAAIDRVHYVVNDSVNLTNQFRVSSSASSTNSRIYYQYPIQSFDVVEFNGKDVIAVATQAPSTISQRANVDQVEKYIEVSGGILSWTYRDGIWSDHVNVDIVDNLDAKRVRKSIRLSVTNDRLCATAFVSTGASPFVYTSYRMYVSKDGLHWSFGQIVPLDVPATNVGLKIATVANAAFAIDYGGIYRSDCTLALGFSPTITQADISDDVNSLNISFNNAASASLEVDNEDDFYNNHAILNQDNTIALEVFAGYYIVGQGALKVLIATLEVDALDFDHNPENRIIKMVARDRLAWMMDKYASEDAEYFEGHLVGSDSYLDLTTSKYGGLSHTAQQSGSWKTEGNLLELRSNNEEGISFSTFKAYLWNGSYQTSVKLSQASATEYAGVIFRALDKDNLWYAVYKQSTDKIHLYERRAGTDTQQAVLGSTLGRASDVSTYLHVRVEFYYAQIRILYSTDGITWTTAFTYIAKGQHSSGATDGMLLDRGYVGQIAQGYQDAELDSWSFPDYVFPDFTWDPFDFNDLYQFPMPTSDEDDGLFSSDPANAWYILFSGNNEPYPRPLAGGIVTFDSGGGSYSFASDNDGIVASGGNSGNCLQKANMDRYEYLSIDIDLGSPKQINNLIFDIYAETTVFPISYPEYSILIDGVVFEQRIFNFVEGQWLTFDSSTFIIPPSWPITGQVLTLKIRPQGDLSIAKIDNINVVCEVI